MLEDLQTNVKCVGKTRLNFSCHFTTNKTEVSPRLDQHTNRCVSPPCSRPMEDQFLSMATDNLSPRPTQVQSILKFWIIVIINNIKLSHILIKIIISVKIFGTYVFRLLLNTYVVGSKIFRPDRQKPRQMENAVRDI
jgi:hypothetical protein